jgi:hypothetical protein
MAWWLPIQQYFSGRPQSDLFQMGPKDRVHLPTSQILDASAVRQLALLRDQALQEPEQQE